MKDNVTNVKHQPEFMLIHGQKAGFNGSAAVATPPSP